MLKKLTEFNKVLCTFDSLYDYDDAVVRFVLNNYKNSFFIKEEAYKYTNFYRHYLLANRKDSNPLSIIIKDEFKNQISNLEKEIYDNHLDEVLKIIKPSNLFELIQMLKEMSGYSITVECKSELEYKIINSNKEFTGGTIIGCEKNTNPYFVFVFRDYHNLFNRDSFKGKTIYFWDTSQNYEVFENDQKLLNTNIISLMGLNIIKMISPYANLVTPEN